MRLYKRLKMLRVIQLCDTHHCPVEHRTCWVDDDTISDEDLIKHAQERYGDNFEYILKEKFEPFVEANETVTEFADRCKECGARYGKLLEQKSCDWTPVSEPPKEHGQYLVTIEIKEDCSYVDKLSYSHNLYSIDRFDFAGEKRPGWYDYDSEVGYYEVKNVTAWMPLPETYKESESKQYANLAKSFVKGFQAGLLNESEDKE